MTTRPTPSNINLLFSDQSFTAALKRGELETVSKRLAYYGIKTQEAIDENKRRTDEWISNLGIWFIPALSFAAVGRVFTLLMVITTSFEEPSLGHAIENRNISRVSLACLLLALLSVLARLVMHPSDGTDTRLKELLKIEATKTRSPSAKAKGASTITEAPKTATFPHVSGASQNNALAEAPAKPSVVLCSETAPENTYHLSSKAPQNLATGC